MVNLAEAKVARFSLEPGWRWSESVKPIVGTDSCQARHVGVIVSGQMHVTNVDGSAGVMSPGMAYVIEPGHDAWVEGAEPVVAYEFESATAGSFAVPAT